MPVVSTPDLINFPTGPPVNLLEWLQTNAFLKQFQRFPVLPLIKQVQAVLEDLRPLTFELLVPDVVHGLHLAGSEAHVAAVSLIAGHLFNL